MARHNIDNLSWREVVWQRPYEQDKVHELLAHLAVLTPRGAVIFESRSHGGFVKHYIGADSTYISKIENTIKIHGDIRIPHVSLPSPIPDYPSILKLHPQPFAQDWPRLQLLEARKNPSFKSFWEVHLSRKLQRGISRTHTNHGCRLSCRASKTHHSRPETLSRKRTPSTALKPVSVSEYQAKDKPED